MERKKTIAKQELIKLSDSDSLNSFSKEVFDSLHYGIIILEKIDNAKGELSFIYKYQNKVVDNYFGNLININYKDSAGIFNEALLQDITTAYTHNIPFYGSIIYDDPKRKLNFDIQASKISKGILITLLERPAENTDGESAGKGKFNSLTLNEAKEKINELEKANLALKNDINNQIKELADKNTLLFKVNNDLDNFIYTATHDLRSPISNIEGLLNALILELPEENPEVQHIISLLSLSLNKFNSLLNDLSEIAQIQTNDEEDQLINLTELFQDVKFGLHEEVIKYGAVVEGHFANAQEINFSRKNLTVILKNLISNALKYSSPSRMSEVLISTSKTDEYFILYIKDNGLGIKPEDKEKIFSVFKRIYTHVAGSGVGLFIVKRIVDHNGGKIEVESEVNKGTTIKIFLRSQS